MSESKHTPKLPFKLGGCSGRMIEDAEGYLTCDCDLLANAEFIVHACNNHNDLLEACREAKYQLEGTVIPMGAKKPGTPIFRTIRQLEFAIAKGRERSKSCRDLTDSLAVSRQEQP